jgi:tetratricopeptide (TPR) repeat protein
MKFHSSPPPISWSVSLILVFLLLPLLVGCKNPLNQATAQKYYRAAEKAEKAGDYQLAKINYGKALANARLGGIDREMEALALYEWSRSSGYCGELDAASEGFKEVLELSKGSLEAQRLRTPALCELARLYFDNQRYAESLEFFKEATPSLEALGAKKDDPIGYCLFLDDYKVALQKTGDNDQAKALNEKIVLIKQSNPDREALFIPKRYSR